MILRSNACLTVPGMTKTYCTTTATEGIASQEVYDNTERFANWSFESSRRHSKADCKNAHHTRYTVWQIYFIWYIYFASCSDKDACHHDSMLWIWQVSMLMLRNSTITQPGNWRQVFRGKQESAPWAVLWKIKSALLWLLEISSLTPWTAMAVSSWERINRYCTINPCSFCARLFPEPWLRWKKSIPSTSRISSTPASLLTVSGNYACIYISDKNAFLCHQDLKRHIYVK